MSSHNAGAAGYVVEAKGLLCPIANPSISLKDANKPDFCAAWQPLLGLAIGVRVVDLILANARGRD